MGINFYIGYLCARLTCTSASASRHLHLRIGIMDRIQTPSTATSQFIQAGRLRLHLFRVSWKADIRPSDDDDDIDESAIPGFSHPTMRPSTPPVGKGKLRAPEQLALPTGSAPPNQLSGNIGAPTPGASGGTRQNFGGIQVESRSRICAPLIIIRETHFSVGPAGLIPSTNRSPPRSSVTVFAPLGFVLTAG